jgi:hypothetical protein
MVTFVLCLAVRCIGTQRRTRSCRQLGYDGAIAGGLAGILDLS